MMAFLHRLPLTAVTVKQPSPIRLDYFQNRKLNERPRTGYMVQVDLTSVTVYVNGNGQLQVSTIVLCLAESCLVLKVVFIPPNQETDGILSPKSRDEIFMRFVGKHYEDLVHCLHKPHADELHLSKFSSLWVLSYAPLPDKVTDSNSERLTVVGGAGRRSAVSPHHANHDQGTHPQWQVSPNSPKLTTAKHLINEPDTLVIEGLKGLLRANPELSLIEHEKGNLRSSL
jgi:hypothetical protein